MAKMTQAEVRAKADEWYAIDARIKKAEAARDAELEPLIARHRAKIEPIYERHAPAIDKLRAKKLEIEGEIVKWLAGHDKPITIAGEKAVAANEQKIGNRVISPQKFFNFVKERSEAFWACLTVGIAKAEELIGKQQVDEISTKPKSLVPTLRAK